MREGREIPLWQWGHWRPPLETFLIHAPSWEVALITLHHATAKDLHMSFLRPLYYPRRGHSFLFDIECKFTLTFVADIVTMSYREWERNWESLSSLSLCLGGWFGWPSQPLTNNRKRNFGSDTLGWFDSVLEMLFSLDIWHLIWYYYYWTDWETTHEVPMI